jgi:hypothetical protein
VKIRVQIFEKTRTKRNRLSDRQKGIEHLIGQGNKQARTVSERKNNLSHKEDRHTLGPKGTSHPCEPRLLVNTVVFLSNMEETVHVFPHKRSELSRRCKMPAMPMNFLKK